MFLNVYLMVWLALTFEFVRSKKGSLYEENVKIMMYVCNCSYIVSFVVKSPSGGKNPWKTADANPRMSLFEKCFKSWFDTVRLWGMSYFFWFTPELLIYNTILVCWWRISFALEFRSQCHIFRFESRLVGNIIRIAIVIYNPVYNYNYNFCATDHHHNHHHPWVR